MNIPIHIEPNKHICIFFQPRSGSTALRSYLVNTIPNLQNLEEFFNLFVQYKFEYRNNKFHRTEFKSINFSEEEKKIKIQNRLRHLDSCTKNQLFCVFTAFIQSYMNESPELTSVLVNRPDTQSFYLDRADVLTALLSTEVAYRTRVFHNFKGSQNNTRSIDSFSVGIPRIKKRLENYLQSVAELNKVAPGIQKIYYEYFQLTPGNISNLFSGITNPVVAPDVNRFEDQVNYKDYIINIDEIENLYHDFVNNNIEYFPQYCGQAPMIQIPEFQGRQPYVSLV